MREHHDTNRRRPLSQRPTPGERTPALGVSGPECRRCLDTHWISVHPDRIGRPIVTLDEHRLPCSRCNPDGVLPPAPRPMLAPPVSREDQSA